MTNCFTSTRSPMPDTKILFTSYVNKSCQKSAIQLYCLHSLNYYIQNICHGNPWLGNMQPTMTNILSRHQIRYVPRTPPPKNMLMLIQSKMQIKISIKRCRQVPCFKKPTNMIMYKIQTAAIHIKRHDHKNLKTK